MTTKLNQWLAIERGVRTQIEKATTKIHNQMQKSPTADQSPMRGILQIYRPIDEENGEKFPPKSRHVQIKAEDAIEQFKELYIELFNLTATKDWANTEAKANVVVDGDLLLAGVPATHLLWLEKQLVEVRTFVMKLPVLPEDFEWEFDDNKGVFATKPVETHKTKKVLRNHVLAEATDRHPAQVQPYNEDILVGYWKTVHYSGAILGSYKRETLKRVEKLLRAVQMAREEANQIEASKMETGQVLLDYIF